LADRALGVSSPVSPLEFLGDDGLVAVADEFEFLVFVVEDFQEEEPAELFQSLGIAGDAAILPHDVSDIFDDGRDVGHGEKRVEIVSAVGSIVRSDERGRPEGDPSPTGAPRRSFYLWTSWSHWMTSGKASSPR
jgi:hypothetical protein